MASAFLSKPSASASSLRRIASASARPFASMASASCSCANFSASAWALRASASFCVSKSSASAWRWRSINCASAACWREYFSASACLRMLASSSCSRTLTSRSLTSASFSCFMILASAATRSCSRRCTSASIPLAASALACAISASCLRAACFSFNSFCFWAISKSAATRLSLANLSCSASTSLRSRSALAFAIRASFLMVSTFSIPRLSITPPSSEKDWTVKAMTSNPILARSGATLSWTFEANSWRSLTILRSSIWPITSRRFPSKTSWTELEISVVFQLRKFSAARAIISSVVPIFSLTAASARTLIKSRVGTASDVRTSVENCSISK